jgi:hypothetical protein
MMYDPWMFTANCQRLSTSFLRTIERNGVLRPSVEQTPARQIVTGNDQIPNFFTRIAKITDFSNLSQFQCWSCCATKSRKYLTTAEATEVQKERNGWKQKNSLNYPKTERKLANRYGNTCIEHISRNYDLIAFLSQKINGKSVFIIRAQSK